jgi:hypothetical protein
MRRFATIKGRNSRGERTAPGFTRLLECNFKQSHNQKDKDAKFILADLDKEGFVANLHLLVLLQPPVFRHRGLIALNAICAQKSQTALSKSSHQFAREGRQLLFQYSGRSDA